MSKLDILLKYKDAVVDMPFPSEDYWKKDAELCEELARKHEEEARHLRPIDGLKLFERFTI